MAEDVDEPDSNAEWNWQERRETETERLDRNWADLLQELRVVQTGGQLLTGLLLTVPFQARFVELSLTQRMTYLVALSLSVASTALLVAPVAMHRLLFRQRARRPLLSTGQRLTLAGLAALALAVTASVFLIFDVVLGTRGGIIAGVVAFALFGVLWLLLPMGQRAKATSRTEREPDPPGHREHLDR